MFPCKDDNKLAFKTKMPWNDEDLARHPGPTRRPDRHIGLYSYRDARWHLKRSTTSILKKFFNEPPVVSYPH